MLYTGDNPADPAIAMDGFHISTTVAITLANSRGSTTLASTDPAAAPVIDPNYHSTKVAMRTDFGQIARVLLGTPEGQEMVVRETVAADVEHSAQNLKTKAWMHLCDVVAGMIAFLPTASLCLQLIVLCSTLYHPGGSASMRKVVDSNLCVYGIKHLRIVDASVVPLPLAAQYQASIYALAEQAVDILWHIQP